MPILSSVETPETLPEPEWEPAAEAQPAPRRGGPSLWGMGEQITWITGLVLALSALTGWYSGEGEGVTVSVIGWHTGVLGKLVLAIGLLAILVVALRQRGVDLPAAVPESLVVIALGALATVFVLVTGDLDPGRVLLRRARDRALDQPSRIGGADRRRAVASIRRAIATATPRTAPASTSNG